MAGISTQPITPTKLTLTMNELDTAATGVLTSDTTNPDALDTVTIGEIIYTFVTSLAALQATGTIDSGATGPSAADTIVIGDETYEFVSALTEAYAGGVLTSDATAPDDGETVTVGDVVYTFKTALSSGPTVPNEVLIGASAAAALDNLKLAINAGAGEGTNYSTGTVVNPDFTATTNTDTEQTVVANVLGVAGNAFAKEETSAHLDWDGATAFMTGGVDAIVNEILIEADVDDTLQNLADAIDGAAGEGTIYSTGTVANADVESGALDDTAHTLVVNAIVAGIAGNSIVFTESMTDATITGAGTLINGKDASVAYDVVIGVDTDTTLGNLKAAINGAAGEGTKYATGTDAHPDVTCGDVTANAVTVTAIVAGLAGNSIAKVEDSSHLDWDGAGAVLTGGDINDIDTIPFGSSGLVKKLLVQAPVISGSATFVLRVKDADGVIVLASSALNENALSSVDVDFVLVPDDVIEIDVDTDLTEEEVFTIIAR